MFIFDIYNDKKKSSKSISQITEDKGKNIDNNFAIG